MRVDVGSDSSVGAEDGLDIDINKVVVGIDMLFDKTLDSEESRE